MTKNVSIEFPELPEESNGLEAKIEVDPNLKEGETGSKYKIIVFGVILTYNGIFMGIGFAKFSTFFTYFMKGKFGSRVASSEYNDILSLLNTMFVLGMTVSSIFTIKLFQWFSLTKLQLVFIVCIIVTVFLQIWADLTALYVLRFVIGFFSGGLFILGPILVNQCIPSSFTGAFGLLFSIFIALGITISSSISEKISQRYWQVFLVVLVPMELFRLMMIIGFCRYESPYHVYKTISNSVEKKLALPSTQLGSRGELTGLNSASESIKKLKYDKFIAHPKVRLLVRSFYQKSSWQMQKKFMFQFIHKFFEDKKMLKGVCQTAWSRDFRKQFLVSLVLYASNQLTGVNIYVMYSNQVLVGLGMEDPNFYIFLSGKADEGFAFLWARFVRFHLSINSDGSRFSTS